MDVRSIRMAWAWAAAFALALAIACVFGQATAYADDATMQAASVSSADGAAAKQAVEAAEAKKLARKVIDDGLYVIRPVVRTDCSVAVKDGSTRAGARVLTAQSNDADWAQKWAIAWDEKSGYYKIRNLNSRKFLGVSKKVKSGAALKQFSYAKKKAQLWQPVVTSAGVEFKSAGTKYVLAVATGTDGALALKLKSSKSGNAEARTFALSVVDPIEADKTYFLRNVSTRQRLQVAGDSADEGARLGLGKAANTKAQKFRVMKAGSAYRLQCVHSCYFATAQGSAVRQSDGKAGAAKKWKLKFDVKSATFSIVSKAGGKRMTAASGKLKLKKKASGKSQQFALSPTYAFKVYLNPGHGANSNGNGIWDTGAVGNGYTEAEFSHDLTKRVQALLADSDVEVVNGEVYELAFWLRLPKAVELGCDAIVSIHFDAGGGSGTLKMMGVQEKAPGSEELAQAIHEGVVSNLGLIDRGPSYRSDITCVNGPIPSMLTEICFMDNATDVQTYLQKRDDVARGIADGIVKASRDRTVIR